MSKVDIIKSAKADGIAENSLFEDWKIMRQALEDKERKFKEISINKVHALTVCIFIRIPVTSICIAVTHSIVCSFFCGLSLSILLFIFFRWKRFYAYRSAFPTKSSISVNEANETLDYPKFLIKSDFKFFSQSGLCKNTFYDEKVGVLFLGESSKPSTEEFSMVEDEPNFSISDLVNSLKIASESIVEDSLRSAVVKLYSSLDSIPADAFDTQFGKHLLGVYLEPLSKLLNFGKDASGTDYQKLLELLQILDFFVEYLNEARQVFRSDSFSIDLDTMLRLAKMDRKVVER